LAGLKMGTAVGLTVSTVCRKWEAWGEPAGKGRCRGWSVCVGHESEVLVRGCIVASWERKMCGGRACVGMKKRSVGFGREKSKPWGRWLFVFG
jgi:hypothetical protein